MFFEEFSSYLESVILSPELLILPGDFNFHTDVASDVDAQVFSDLLTSMGLKQHVTVPTHIRGHTLDLLITREHDPVICSAPVADRYLSDHASVLCSLNSPKPGHVVKEISYRKLKSIDFDSLCSDLTKIGIVYERLFFNLCELTSSYNSTLSSLLDEQAPLKKEKTVISRQRVPWFNSSDIKGTITVRGKAERKWRNTNSQQDLRAFEVARNHTTYLFNSARRDYFCNLIAENSSNRRKLFRTTNSFLFEPTDVSFPDHIPPNDLAYNFGNCFEQKIERINDSLDALQSSLTQDQVFLIIGKAAMKSLPLDPAPTSVVLQVLDVRSPVITV